MKFIKILKARLSINDRIKVYLRNIENNKDHISVFWHLYHNQYDKQNRIALNYGENLISFVEDKDDIVSTILSYYIGKSEDAVEIKLGKDTIYKE